jgi:endonuclease YncB( thermonuclease family)
MGAAALLLFCACLAQAAPSSMTVSGTAETVDGDTLDVGSARVRLFGIDAPETAQECVMLGARNGPADAPLLGRSKNSRRVNR